MMSKRKKQRFLTEKSDFGRNKEKVVTKSQDKNVKMKEKIKKYFIFGGGFILGLMCGMTIILRLYHIY